VFWQPSLFPSSGNIAEPIHVIGHLTIFCEYWGGFKTCACSWYVSTLYRFPHTFVRRQIVALTLLECLNACSLIECCNFLTMWFIACTMWTNSVRFEVRLAVALKFADFWIVLPYSLVEAYICSKLFFCHHHKGRQMYVKKWFGHKVCVSFFYIILFWKIEAVTI